MRQPDLQSKKQHIAIYLPSLRGGGAERVMVTLANGFADLGHRVDLVLARAEGPYLSEVSPDVRLVNLNRRRVLFSMLPLAIYLRRERPDSMLSALNHANIIAILARMLARVKMRLVVSERNSLESVRGGVLFRLMRIFYPYADGVVAVSQGLAKELVAELGLSANRVTAIPNPVDVEGIRQKALERPLHPWLAPGEPPVILAVGRLSAQKDYPGLLEAFAQLRANRNARLIILGEGSLRAELEQRVASMGLSDAVALLGFQSNPFGWMASCSVYVMSSRYEGFPNSLVQAMACGARVVSTDCPTGPDEILESGRWGRLVPVGDVGALSRALTTAMDDQSPQICSKRINDFQPLQVISNYLSILMQLKR